MHMYTVSKYVCMYIEIKSMYICMYYSFVAANQKVTHTPGGTLRGPVIESIKFKNKLQKLVYVLNTHYYLC